MMACFPPPIASDEIHSIRPLQKGLDGARGMFERLADAR